MILGFLWGMRFLCPLCGKLPHAHCFRYRKAVINTDQSDTDNAKREIFNWQVFEHPCLYDTPVDKQNKSTKMLTKRNKIKQNKWKPMESR